MFYLSSSPHPQTVVTDGCPPRAWFCPKFLPVKIKFFLPTVTEFLQIGDCLIVGVYYCCHKQEENHPEPEIWLMDRISSPWVSSIDFSGNAEKCDFPVDEVHPLIHLLKKGTSISVWHGETPSQTFMQCLRDISTWTALRNLWWISSMPRDPKTEDLFNYISDLTSSNGHVFPPAPDSADVLCIVLMCSTRCIFVEILS